MKEQNLALLKRQLEEIEKIGKNPRTSQDYSFSIDAWKSATISIIERIFGKESRKITEIEKIKLKSYYDLNGPLTYNIETVKETARSIIEACIAEIDYLGLPEQKYDGDDKGINLTVVQSQSNQQTIKLELLVSILRNELKGKELEEIQDILNNNPDLETKKNKTIEKLKSFGLDTLSGIVSGILTNPQIWGM